MGFHNGPRYLGNESQSATPAVASGGTETVIEQNGKYYRVHSFTTVGESTLNVTRGGELEYLIVGGGGGGGHADGDGGGGGGGGKCLVGKQTFLSGTKSILVGSGGVGGFILSAEDNSYAIAEDGEISSFEHLASSSGKAPVADARPIQLGKSSNGGESGSGNSGGNGLRITIDGTQNASTSFGGGGGGENSIGITASGNTTGEIVSPDGGTGISSFISGNEQFFGGGGGGGTSRAAGLEEYGRGVDGGGDGGSVTQSGNSGQENTGGGGGGTGRAFGSSVFAGNGASGIVIIRYRITKQEYEQA